MKKAGNAPSAINSGVKTLSTTPPRRHAASIPRNVPIDEREEERHADEEDRVRKRAADHLASPGDGKFEVEIPKSP